MSVASHKTIKKIKLMLYPDAETPEEYLTYSTENIPNPLYEFNLSLNSLKFIEFLELCTQPKTDEEKDRIILDFKNKLKSVSEKDSSSVFDVLCLYALYHTYETSSSSLPAVSRSLYAWYKLDDLVSHKYKHRNSMIDPEDDSFLTELCQFTDIYTNSESLKVAVFAAYESFMGGNLALTRFLLKFGLIEFECNERGIDTLSLVVKKFKENTEVVLYTDPAVLAWRMKKSKFTFRRATLTFYTIAIVSEYRMFEWAAAELDEETFEQLKSHSIQKLRCLDLLINSTTETKITFKDIECYTATISNPFRKPEFSMCDFLDTFRKMSSEVTTNYNPRSLKDLARCKIRACLQSRLMLPEKVKELPVADPLKDFILFHCESMWDMLEQSHLHVKFIYE